MSTIAENLTKLQTIKADIKQAIIDKGQEVGDDMTVYASAIASIKSDSTSGLITEFSGELTFNSASELSVLNNYATIGALLWYKDDGTYVVTNGNSSASDYWNPKSSTVTTPTKDSYTLTGVCCGRGLWVAVGALSTSSSTESTTYAWAASSSDAIYTSNHAVMVHGTGWEATQHILNTHSNVISDTVWEQLYDSAQSDKAKRRNGIAMYLPSKYELQEVQMNCCDNNHAKDGDDAEKQSDSCTYNYNLGKLLSLSTYYYWSSSQCPNSYVYAYSVNFDGGCVGYDFKSGDYLALALLHLD